MSWWTTLAGLTPLAAWDAERTTAAQMSDGVGTNHLTRTGGVWATTAPHKMVPGNANLLRFATPIDIPTTGMFFAMWVWQSRSHRPILYSMGDGTSNYAIYQDTANSWFISNTLGTVDSLVGNDMQRPAGEVNFAAIVHDASTRRLYVNNQFLGNTTPRNSVPTRLAAVGGFADGHVLTLHPDEGFLAGGFFSGATTLAQMQALELALRLQFEFLGQAQLRSFATALGRLSTAPQGPGGMNIRAAEFNRRLGRGRVWFDGAGRITGTVKEKSTPANTPLARQVLLFADRGWVLVDSTWSHPVTGAYAFDNLETNQTYTVVSIDHTTMYRAVIADRIRPELPAGGGP